VRTFTQIGEVTVIPTASNEGVEIAVATVAAAAPWAARPVVEGVGLRALAA